MTFADDFTKDISVASSSVAYEEEDEFVFSGLISKWLLKHPW